MNAINFMLIYTYKSIKFNSKDTLLKKTNLKFEVSSNIKPPYTIYWRITNSGKETELAYCLRGDFYNQSIRKGKFIREETAMYKCVHTLECFIVKNGI